MMIIIKININVKLFIDDPNRDSNKWPAIMFAVSRIDNVHGRIIFLIVSIITIKFINIVGVFNGTKWINIDL